MALFVQLEEKAAELRTVQQQHRESQDASSALISQLQLEVENLLRDKDTAERELKRWRSQPTTEQLRHLPELQSQAEMLSRENEELRRELQLDRPQLSNFIAIAQEQVP